MTFVRFAIPITGILLMWAAAYSGLWKKVQRRIVESILGILLMGTCVYLDLWPLAPIAAMVTAHGLIRRCGPYYALPALLPLVAFLSFFLTGSTGLPFLTGSTGLPRFDILRGVLGAIASLATLTVTARMCAEVLIVHRGGDRRAARRMITSLLVAPVFPTKSRLQRFFASYVSTLRILQVVGGGRVVHSMPPSEDFQMPGPGILIIRSGNAAILERSGKITRIVGPGFYLTETWEHLSVIVDLSLQSKSWKHEDALRDVLTKDSIPLEVEFTVQYRIMIDQPPLIAKAEYKLDEDAIRRAVLTTADWKKQTEVVGEAILRDTIATRFLDEIYDPRSLRFSSGATPRVPLQHEIRRRLSRESQRWGVEIVRVNLDKITLPQQVEQRMIEAWDVTWHDVVEMAKALTEAKAITAKAIGAGRAAYIEAVNAARARLEAAGIDRFVKLLQVEGEAWAGQQAAEIGQRTKWLEARGEGIAELEAVRVGAQRTVLEAQAKTRARMIETTGEAWAEQQAAGIGQEREALDAEGKALARLRAAQIDQRTAEVEAQITRTEATARADAKAIESQAEAAAEAERWRAVILSLQRDLILDADTIRQVVVKLAGVLTTVDDFQAMVRFFNVPRPRIIGDEEPAEFEQPE